MIYSVFSYLSVEDVAFDVNELVIKEPGIDDVLERVVGGLTSQEGRLIHSRLDVHRRQAYHHFI